MAIEAFLKFFVTFYFNFFRLYYTIPYIDAKKLFIEILWSSYIL